MKESCEGDIKKKSVNDDLKNSPDLILACCNPWGCRLGHNLVTEQQQRTMRILILFVKGQKLECNGAKIGLISRSTSKSTFSSVFL